MSLTDQQAEAMLAEALQTIDDYYKERGIFQDRFGFGERPAIVVVDFAYGWTDEAYAGGTARLDEPVARTAELIEAGRAKNIPIIYTTSPYRPHQKLFKTAADQSDGFRAWDERACEIDERVKPEPRDLIIQKDSASAFHGSHLAGYLVQHAIDTVLITGCSTSACIRATATDAKSYRFRPVIVRECVGDRSPVAHVFTLADIQARFSDVVSLEETLQYLDGV